MSPVKLSCAACATLAFSRHSNRAVVVIRQDSMPGAEVLTSWKQCNTGGYTRSPGLSARLSPPGCCHSYHTQRCWQGKAVTITLAWLPLPFCSPSTHKQTPLLSFGGSPSSASFASAAKEMLLLHWSSNKDLLWHMHHILTLMHCVEIWWVNHVKAWHFLGGERVKTHCVFKILLLAKKRCSSSPRLNGALKHSRASKGRLTLWFQCLSVPLSSHFF